MNTAKFNWTECEIWKYAAEKPPPFSSLTSCFSFHILNVRIWKLANCSSFTMPIWISPYTSVLSSAGGQYCMHITWKIPKQNKTQQNAHNYYVFSHLGHYKSIENLNLISNQHRIECIRRTIGITWAQQISLDGQLRTCLDYLEHCVIYTITFNNVLRSSDQTNTHTHTQWIKDRYQVVDRKRWRGKSSTWKWNSGSETIIKKHWKSKLVVFFLQPRIKLFVQAV